MAIPPLQRQLAEKQIEYYCKTKIPKEVQNEIQLKYSVRGNSFTLMESRPKWDDDSEWIDMKIAKMTFDIKSMKWKLYWSNQHQKFFSYDGLSPKTEIKDLLKEIDEDPTCIFWG